MRRRSRPPAARGARASPRRAGRDPPADRGSLAGAAGSRATSEAGSGSRRSEPLEIRALVEAPFEGRQRSPRGGLTRCVPVSEAKTASASSRIRQLVGRPVGQGLGDVLGAHRVGLGERRDRARNPSDARVPAPGEMQPVGSAAEQGVGLRIPRAAASSRAARAPRSRARRRPPSSRSARKPAPPRARAASRAPGRSGRAARATACPGSGRAVAPSSCTAPPDRRGRRTGRDSSSRRAESVPGRRRGRPRARRR